MRQAGEFLELEPYQKRDTLITEIEEIFQTAYAFTREVNYQTNNAPDNIPLNSLVNQLAILSFGTPFYSNENWKVLTDESRTFEVLVQCRIEFQKILHTLDSYLHETYLYSNFLFQIIESCNDETYPQQESLFNEVLFDDAYALLLGELNYFITAKKGKISFQLKTPEFYFISDENGRNLISPLEKLKSNLEEKLKTNTTLQDICKSLNIELEVLINKEENCFELTVVFKDDSTRASEITYHPINYFQIQRDAVQTKIPVKTDDKHTFNIIFPKDIFYDLGPEFKNLRFAFYEIIDKLKIILPDLPNVRDVNLTLEYNYDFENKGREDCLNNIRIQFFESDKNSDLQHLDPPLISINKESIRAILDQGINDIRNHNEELYETVNIDEIDSFDDFESDQFIETSLIIPQKSFSILDYNDLNNEELINALQKLSELGITYRIMLSSNILSSFSNEDPACNSTSKVKSKIICNTLKHIEEIGAENIGYINFDIMEHPDQSYFPTIIIWDKNQKIVSMGTLPKESEKIEVKFSKYNEELIDKVINFFAENVESIIEIFKSDNVFEFIDFFKNTDFQINSFDIRSYLNSLTHDDDTTFLRCFFEYLKSPFIRLSEKNGKIELNETTSTKKN